MLYELFPIVLRQKVIVSLYIFTLLSACVDGNSGLPPPPIPEGSPGGIWTGTDSNGDSIFAVITEDGQFRFLDITTKFQGFGILNVSDEKEISASYQSVPAFGLTFADGSLISDCDASGMLVERKTLSVTITCATDLGSIDTSTVDLSFDGRYEHDSDLATFAGNWTFSGNPGFDVMSVAADGLISGQDGNGTNCVYGGQVAIIDPEFNVYDVAWGYSNCTGAAAVLNGVTFGGIASINRSTHPDELIFGGTGIVEGVLVSWILTYQKM